MLSLQALHFFELTLAMGDPEQIIFFVPWVHWSLFFLLSKSRSLRSSGVDSLNSGAFLPPTFTCLFLVPLSSSPVRLP